MHLKISNLLAAVTIALIAMAITRQCAGQQATANRLGNDLLSDLRSDRMQASTGDLPASESFHARPPRSLSQTAIETPMANSLPNLQQVSVSDYSTARRTQTFFDNDQPSPVVVVWLNSDLQKPLLSEGQLKQMMQSIPERDQRTRQVEGNGWQANSRSHVRHAGFEQPVHQAPLGVKTAEQQIEDFTNRLAAIRSRFELKSTQIAADESVDGIVKSELGNLLGIAGDWIERAASGLKEYEDETAARHAFRKNLGIRETELAKEQKLATKDLFAESEDPFSNVRNNAIDKLQKDLKKHEAFLQASTDKRNEVRKQISARDQRATELPGLKRKNTTQEDETKRLLEELNGQPDDLNRSLQKLRYEAKFLSLEITEKLLDLESRREEQDGQILPLELEELTLRIRRVTAELTVLRKQSDILRDKQLDERRKAARGVLNEKLTQSTPQLKELAEFNIDLVVQKKSMAVKSDELEKELINVEQQKTKLSESQKRIENQIKTLGPTASGIRLVEHRRSLISTGKSQNRLLELADRLQHKQARKLLVKERRDQLVLGDFFKLEVLANVEEQVQDPVQRQMAVDVANQLMETEKEYANDLLTMFEDNIQKLSQLEAAHKTLIDEVKKARSFSDKNALWVRSAKPIEFNDFKLCQAGLQSIITSDQWRGIGVHAYNAFQKRPYDVGLLAMVVGSLFVVRRRLRWSHE